MATGNTPEIVHDFRNQRFTIPLDPEPAELSYDVRKQPDGSKLVDFTRTFVPKTHRNGGLAEALVRHGLRWARENGYAITASCWYAERFVKK